MKYVDGSIHTNGIENFWSLLKRSLAGTYVSVEPFHLFRYLDEQTFRFNNRNKMNDGDRFSKVVSQVKDKRVTYKELIGKNIGRRENAVRQLRLSDGGSAGSERSLSPLFLSFLCLFLLI